MGFSSVRCVAFPRPPRWPSCSSPRQWTDCPLVATQVFREQQFTLNVLLDPRYHEYPLAMALFLTLALVFRLLYLPPMSSASSALRATAAQQFIQWSRALLAQSDQVLQMSSPTWRAATSALLAEVVASIEEQRTTAK